MLFLLVYTHGGNSNNAPCVFPFKYEGKTYEDCTSTGCDHGSTWCSTTSSYERDGKWGHCLTDKELRNCVDRHKKCPNFALNGECLINPAYMNKRCSRSCGMCTFGGNSHGKRCSFPFIFNNKVINKCLVFDQKTWCATTSNFDLKQKWGYCLPKCKLISIVTFCFSVLYYWLSLLTSDIPCLSVYAACIQVQFLLLSDWMIPCVEEGL